jgi:hypothetical protein
MKVLLIGNGPSALEQKMGEIIDSKEFDIVCRFNRGHKQDNGKFNKGYEEYVGTRCDYWIISDLRINLAIQRYKDYQGIFISTPGFKWNLNVAKDIEEKYDNIKFIPPLYEDDINKIVDFSPKWPSTGVIGIHFAVNHFEEVFIYGFDTYDVKYNTIHYFENKENKYKNINNKDHSPLKEKEYLSYMLKNNKIKLLK